MVQEELRIKKGEGRGLGYNPKKALPTVDYLLTILSTLNCNHRIFAKDYVAKGTDLGLKSKDKMKIQPVGEFTHSMFEGLPEEFYIKTGKHSKARPTSLRSDFDKSMHDVYRQNEV